MLVSHLVLPTVGKGRVVIHHNSARESFLLLTIVVDHILLNLQKEEAQVVDSLGSILSMASYCVVIVGDHGQFTFVSIAFVSTQYNDDSALVESFRHE